MGRITDVLFLVHMDLIHCAQLWTVFAHKFKYNFGL